MFARGVVSLHTAHPPASKNLASNSRVSITYKLIQTKGLQVYCFGHLRKTGGWGSYRMVHRRPLLTLDSQPTEASAKAAPTPLFSLHTKLPLVSPFLPLHTQKNRGVGYPRKNFGLPRVQSRGAPTFSIFPQIFRTVSNSALHRRSHPPPAEQQEAGSKDQRYNSERGMREQETPHGCRIAAWNPYWVPGHLTRVEYGNRG